MKIFIALVVVALAAGALGWYVAQPASPGGVVACTEEAKICPDGSAVGRTGPNCEFAECPSTPSPTPTPTPQPGGGGGVACTADAMQCPDGSWVGRTGPNCQFVCPGSGGILPYNSGIRGTVMAGPTCPVERDPPDPNCADKPVATNISIFRTSDRTHGVAFATSDAGGNFQISLPPGDYIVMAGPNGVPFPSCTDTGATVGPSSYTEILVSCDTGIR